MNGNYADRSDGTRQKQYANREADRVALLRTKGYNLQEGYWQGQRSSMDKARLYVIDMRYAISRILNTGMEAWICVGN